MVNTIIEQARQDIGTLLRNYGIQPTTQRLKIASVMFSKPQHLSAEKILELTNIKETYVSKATVYNTLALFSRHGLIHEVIVDPGKVFYEPAIRPHHHIFNVDTGKLIDIESTVIDFKTFPELPEGTELESVDLVIRVRSIKK